MGDREQSADVELNIAGQRLNVRNVKSLNTTLTAIILGLTCGVLWMLYEHRQENRSMSVEFTAAIRENAKSQREQTAAIREQTCLSKFPEHERRAHADFCRNVTGAGRSETR